MNSSQFVRSFLLLVVGLVVVTCLSGCANITKYSVESYQGPTSSSDLVIRP